MKPKRLVLFAALICLLGPGTLLAGPVNINSADADTLAAELTGIGPVLAAAIVRDREENGHYASPDALTRVSGIGPRIIEMNRENILTSEAGVSAEAGEETG